MPKFNLVVTEAANGVNYIFSAPAPGIPLDFADLVTYEVDGPEAFNFGPDPIVDAHGVWIANQQKGGYSFNETNRVTKEPTSDQAAAVDPKKSYNAEQVADLWSVEPEEVESWMANWEALEGPRLQYRMEKTRLSNGFELLTFLHHYAKDVFK